MYHFELITNSFDLTINPFLMDFHDKKKYRTVIINMIMTVQCTYDVIFFKSLKKLKEK